MHPYPGFMALVTWVKFLGEKLKATIPLKDMEVPHKFAHGDHTPTIFWRLLEIPKTCSFAGSIKHCCILTGLFWDTVDSFGGLFEGCYHMFTCESTSKTDKSNILDPMKILNTTLTQKRSGIRTKRQYKEKNHKTKKGSIRTAWRMRLIKFYQ